MGYSFIKYLESTGYNRKLFYLDSGEADLPAITDKNNIQIGSEAQDLLTGAKWVLDSHYKWVPVPVQGGGGGGIPEIPLSPLNIKYAREATSSGVRWVEAAAAAGAIVNNFMPRTQYEAFQLILNENTLVRARTKFISGNTFVESDWEILSANCVTKILSFQPNYPYRKDEVLVHDKLLYSAIKDFTSGTVFAAADWKLIEINTPAVIRGFTPFYSYRQNEVIIENQAIYAAKASFTSGAAFVLADWSVGAETSGKTYSSAEWSALEDKPEIACITDSIFDR